jgi:hypothetical protein
MSPSRPALRVRPRSAIADPELARAAVTELPGTPLAWRGYGPRALLRAALQTARTLGRPMEPERVIVMPLSVVPATSAPLTRRRR